MTAVHEVYALRYATVARRRRENFIAADDHDAAMPMDYYVWLIRRGERQWLVDTGFGAEAARERGRTLLQCPVDALASFGVDATRLADVIVTHLHYDHAGNLPRFPRARLHLQERELQFATGRCMCHGLFRHAYAVDDVVHVVRCVHEQRVQFHDGDVEIADGLQLLRVGGHTAGLQAVRVHTERGWVVLASDASHFYDNAARATPFPIVWHVGEMLDGWARLAALCDSPEHFVPGHDPLVRQRYPQAAGASPEVVALHRPPLAGPTLTGPTLTGPTLTGTVVTGSAAS